MSAKPVWDVVFVLGGPGAGKGTQCQKIVEEFQFVHLSAGDLLREERANPESKYGELISNYIKEGQIVPVQITCNLLEQAMIKSKKNKFLIDGFPRNRDNVDGWMENMSSKTNLKFVLFFDCSDEVCVNRCLSRGKNSGRTDDNMESLKKRLTTYSESTQPIIQYFGKQNLVRTISASVSVEEVFEDVKTLFNKEFKKP